MRVVINIRSKSRRVNSLLHIIKNGKLVGCMSHFPALSVMGATQLEDERISWPCGRKSQEDIMKFIE